MNLAVLLILTGCAGDDGDGDGFTTAIDCDDADATVHPGAPELCDGVDQDCDDEIDEDPSDGTEGFLDQDGDGHGQVPWASCDATEVAAESGDCDDQDPARHPAAVEHCDGVDEDCNGLTDDDAVDTRLWFADTDADGFGDAETSTSACERPEGYVSDATDCDDTAATAWPGAEEVNSDGLDNDCNGAVDDAPDRNVTGIDTFSNLWIIGTEPGFGLGAAIADPLDLSGDGLPDVVLGAPGGHEDYPNPGQVFVMRGPLTGGVTLDRFSAALVGDAEGDRVGEAVATSTDIDGDGLADLIIGAPGTGLAQGAVHITQSWQLGTRQVSELGLHLQGPTIEADFGAAVADLGDVDGDGWHDMVIGAPLEDTYKADAGRFYFLRGPVTSSADLERSWWVDGEGKKDIFGASIDGVGDTDGDGLDDFLVSATEAQFSGKRTGVAYLFQGPGMVAKVSADAEAAIGGGSGLDYLSTDLSGAGDVDGDGLNDVIIGAPLEQLLSGEAGAAYVLLGPFEGDVDIASSHAILLGKTPGELAGTSVAGGGDLTADGVPDFLVGAPGADGGGVGRGAVYLVNGTVEGVYELTYADDTLLGVADDGAFGAASVIGNLGMTDLGDLIASAPSTSEDGEPAAGRVWALSQ